MVYVTSVADRICSSPADDPEVAAECERQEGGCPPIRTAQECSQQPLNLKVLGSTHSPHPKADLFSRGFQDEERFS